jgi:peptide/nickel transport system substrate-binding protein
LIDRRAFTFGLPALAGLGLRPAFGQAGSAGDTLTVALAAEATTLDPTESSAGVDFYMIGNLFEQLTRADPQGNLVNWLAESYDIGGTPDKPIIDVTLRQGLLFHNNEPVTSADLEFAFHLQKDPKHARFAFMQSNVDGFEVVDDRRFRLHFKQSDALYVANYLTLWAIPKKYYEQVGHDGFVKAPVGTGPWKMVSRTVYEQMQLEAFEGYWNKAHRPTIRNLVIKLIPEDLTRVAAFRTGAVDWIDALPPSMLVEFEKIPGVTTKTLADGNDLFLNLAADQPGSPFKDSPGCGLRNRHGCDHKQGAVRPG